jgi:hypothetical protein
MSRSLIACLGLALAAEGSVIANDLSSAPSLRPDKSDVCQFPSGLRLKGTCSRKGYGDWQFEITMYNQGRYYYRKEWDGDKEWESWDITLIVDDFWGAYGESWGMSGGRGGGRADNYGRVAPEVYRRLWSSPGRLCHEGAHHVEEFEQSAGCRGLNIPKVVRWTDKTSAMPEKTTVYTVRQIEPLDRFDAKFFQRTLKRHFSFAKKYFPAHFRVDVEDTPDWNELLLRR